MLVEDRISLPWQAENIPAHWNVLRIKHLLREVNDRTDTGTEVLLSMRQHRGLVPHNDVSEKEILPEDLIGYKRTEPGDLVMNRMRAATGLFAATKSAGLVSPDYAVFRVSPNVDVDYLVHLFQTAAMGEKFRVESKGLGTGYSGFLRLYTDRFGAIPIAIPSLDEQQAISNYLKAQDSVFAKFVSNRRRLLQVLAERREAITHEAMQHEGAHHLRLSVVADRMNRAIDRANDEVYTPVGLYNRGRGIFHKEPTKGADLGDSTFFWIEEGDFVLSGQFAWEGAVALAGERDSGCVASHRYPILRGKQGLAESGYLLAFFKTAIGHLLLDHHSRGAAGRNRPLNDRTLLKEKIPVPPLPIQQELCELVRAETELNRSMADLIRAIKEYRMQLVAQFVTGQVSVLGLKLPDVEELELDILDEEGEGEEAADDEVGPDENN